jgi:four helix bundle protein
MAVKSYRDLDVWKVSVELAVLCYQVTKPFPKDELFGMVSQIRRATTSVSANIAEGQGRATTKDFLNFLSIARGSLLELETHLTVCQRVGLITEFQLNQTIELSDRVSRMLFSLRRALEEKL